MAPSGYSVVTGATLKAVTPTRLPIGNSLLVTATIDWTGGGSTPIPPLVTLVVINDPNSVVGSIDGADLYDPSGFSFVVTMTHSGTATIQLEAQGQGVGGPDDLGDVTVDFKVTCIPSHAIQLGDEYNHYLQSLLSERLATLVGTSEEKTICEGAIYSLSVFASGDLSDLSS